MAPVIPAKPVGLEKLLQTSGQQSWQRPARRGWNDLVCFSVVTFDPKIPGEGSTVSHSPGGSEDGRYEFTRRVRCGASVSSFTDLVVLVEEAKVGGAQRVQCPRVDQDLRLVAGVAKPASVTVCEDSHESPSVEGTLSSPDLAGKLFSLIPAGIPLPVGPVGRVGLCGMNSPSDLTSIGPVGPVTDPVGPVGPYVACDPVGSYGMLSPCDFTSDPDQPVADGPEGPYVARGPV